MSEKNSSFFSEMIRFGFLTLIIVLPIRFFIAEPFIVSGASMEPTFQNSDYLIVDQISYRFEDPKRGEVIIFEYPENPDKYFIKRIIGLPGDTVILTGDAIRIVNKVNPEGFDLDQSYITHMKPDSGTYVVPAGKYFVMGDNRPASSDSRIWGLLPEDNIVGRAFARLFPPSAISLFPGDHSLPQ